MNQVRTLLESQRYAVLSTRRDDGHPYAALVAFWAVTRPVEVTDAEVAALRDQLKAILSEAIREVLDE